MYCSSKTKEQKRTEMKCKTSPIVSSLEMNVKVRRILKMKKMSQLENLAGNTAGAKNVEESGHDVDKADDLEVLGLRCLHDFNGNCFNKKGTQ
jgi:hypothetical protein